jgi:hypothetical protein
LDELVYVLIHIIFNAVDQSLVKIEDQGVLKASWELDREVWLSKGLAT